MTVIFRNVLCVFYVFSKYTRLFVFELWGNYHYILWTISVHRDTSSIHCLEVRLCCFIVIFIFNYSLYVIPIKNLEAKMVNVTIQGVVKQKTALLDIKSGKGKYFAFYLCEDENQVRVIAYSNCAEKCYPLIINHKAIKITWISKN